MSKTFRDFDIAVRTRDVVNRLILDALARERPRDTYGEVTAIDPDLRRVWVLFPGAEDSVPVSVGAIQPSQVGQIVRVTTVRPGDLVVVDVQGTARLTADTSEHMGEISTLVVNAGPHELFIDWADTYERYEVQVAEDDTFATNVRSYGTISSQITVNSLAANTTYWVRVRHVNTSGTSVGPWSAAVSATTEAFTISSDGNPPDSSPQPIVTAGIGMVTAEWLPATGTTDEVTYEVHVSLTSGFTVGPATLLSETTMTFAVITTLPDSTPLTDHYGDNVFVRVVAKDPDGAAPVSAQGSAQPRNVSTNDVGRIDLDRISDGSAPATSPACTVTNGIGFLLVTWEHVANVDPVTYEIHVSSTSGFTPNANTLSGTTPGRLWFVRQETPQIDPGEGPLDHTSTYYVKVVATDLDGVAAAGTQDSGSPLNPATHNNTNTATYVIDRAAVAEIAIDDANIINGKISNLEAATANIYRANIADLAVGTAQIDNLAVVTAKIGNLAVTDAKIDTLTVSKLTSGTIASQGITITGGLAGFIQSSNFSPGVSGWWIGGTFAEFNSVFIRGQLIGTTGTFAGDLSAAGGTFTGNLVAAGGTFSGNLSAAGGTFAGNLSAAGGTFSGDLSAAGGTFNGAIIGGTIDIGSAVPGGDGLHIDSVGNMWVGAPDPADADLRIDADGTLFAARMDLYTEAGLPGGTKLYGGSIYAIGSGMVIGGLPVTFSSYLWAQQGIQIIADSSRTFTVHEANMIANLASGNPFIITRSNAGPALRLESGAGAATESVDLVGTYMDFYGNSDTLPTQRLGYIGYPNNDDIRIWNETAGGNILFATESVQVGSVNVEGGWVMGSSVTPGQATHAMYVDRASNPALIVVNRAPVGGASTAHGIDIYLGASASPLINTGSDDRYLRFRRPDGTVLGRIEGTGGAVAYMPTSSDIALKENVSADHNIGAAAFDLIPWRSFNWKANGDPGHGVIAQELAEIPEWLHAVSIGGTRTEPDPETGEDREYFEPWSVNYTPFIGAIGAKVKNLEERIALLESAV